VQRRSNSACQIASSLHSEGEIMPYIAIPAKAGGTAATNRARSRISRAGRRQTHDDQTD